MIVRSVDVGRVWVCILCACVSEERGNGEGAGLQEQSRLSGTRRCIRLAADSARGWGLLQEPMVKHRTTRIQPEAGVCCKNQW